MKNWLFFVCGVFTGILAMGFFLFIIGRSYDYPDPQTFRRLEKSPLVISQVEQVKSVYFTPSGFQPEVIEQAITQMVAQNQNSDSCLQLVVDGYTKGLLSQWNGKTNHPDSTYRLLWWAEQIKFYSPVNKDFKLAFDAIGGFWLEHIAHELGKMAISKPGLKYSYSFRYQSDRCAHHHFLVNAPMTPFEKGLTQLLDSRIGYIAGRMAMDLSHIQLWLLTLATAITLAGWILVLKISFSNLKKAWQAKRRKVEP